MQNNIVDSFLNQMFEDRKMFVNMYGIKNVTDANFMLISDVLSENLELFSEVIKEQFVINQNSLQSNIYNKEVTAFN